MKYHAKSNQFQASNVVARLNCKPDEFGAWSYGWWKFVAIIGGKVVFNAHRYSVTTAKHQSKVRTLLREQGIEIDLEVDTRYSLDNFHALADAEKRLKEEAELLVEETKKKGTRLEKNAMRKARAHWNLQAAKQIAKLAKKVA